MFKNSNLILVFLLPLLVQFATDIFTPALPFIAASFSIKENTAQLPVSSNFIGIAISSIIFGAFADLYGRRSLILIGLFIFLIASSLAFYAMDINTLTLSRFFLGLGQGALIILSSACLRDLYEGVKFVKIMSWLSIIIALMSLFTPTLSGIIIKYAGWRSLFTLLMVISSITLIIFIAYFKETLKEKEIKTISWGDLIKTYVLILKNKQFCLFCSFILLTYMWSWAANAMVPFLYIKVMHMPVVYYGLYSSISSSAYILGNYLNQRWIEKIGSKKLLSIGLGLPLITAILLISFYYSISLNPLIIETSFIPASIGTSFIVLNSYMYAMQSIPKNFIARAAGLLKFFELILISLTVYIAMDFYNSTVIPFSIIMIVNSIFSLLLFILVLPRIKQFSCVKN